jgi:hypothetical protein
MGKYGGSMDNRKKDKQIITSKKLKDIAARCQLPQMKTYYGKPKAKINSGLDDTVANKQIAAKREKARQKEFEL